ncbi:MAG: WD40 repeat domain-containing protein [Pseudomonadota bacterium]
MARARAWTAPPLRRREVLAGGLALAVCAPRIVRADAGLGRRLDLGSAVLGLAASRSGDEVLCGLQDGRVLRLTGAAGEARALGRHGGAAEVVAVSPDGRFAVSGSADRTAILWDLEEGRRIRTVSDHSHTVYGAAFHPDGQRFATTSRDRTARLHTVASDRPLHVLAGHAGGVEAAAISPDGTLLATVSWDQSIRLWDVGTGAALTTLTGHERPVWAIAFAGNDRIVSGSWDGTAIVWSLQTRRAIGQYRGHGDRIDAVAVLPGGEVAVTGAFDGTLHAWTIDASTILDSVTLPSAVRSLAVLPGGRLLAGTADGGLYPWEPKT